MTDKTKTKGPELVGTVAVPPNFGDLRGAEYEAARDRLVEAMMAAMRAATPEIAAQVAADKAKAAHQA